MNILLVDDHRIVRDGLRSLLERDASHRVVGEAADGRTAVRLAQKLTPQLVILDVAMPDMNGIEAAQQITRSAPAASIIALSMHSDVGFVGRMLRAGARGYLLKDCAFEEMAAAIDVVQRGQVYLSPSITGVLVDDYVKKLDRGGESGHADVLTPKEREVLQLVAEGHSSKQIAARLHLAVKTIETHRHNIMRKLDLHSFAELTKFAVRVGLTSLD